MCANCITIMTANNNLGRGGAGLIEGVSTFNVYKIALEYRDKEGFSIVSTTL